MSRRVDRDRARQEPRRVALQRVPRATEARGRAGQPARHRFIARPSLVQLRQGAPDPDPGKGVVAVRRILDPILALGGEETTVRLIGVDTPETKHPDKPVQRYGPEAALFLTNLLKGERAFLEYESGSRTGKYGRTIAYLYRAPDGLFVNAEIVRQGYGRVYKAAPFKHRKPFDHHERRAKQIGKGLWAAGQPSQRGPALSSPAK